MQLHRPTLCLPAVLYYHSAMPGDVAQTFPIIPPESNFPCRKIRKSMCWRHSVIELSLLLSQYSLIWNYQKKMQLQHEFLSLKY